MEGLKARRMKLCWLTVLTIFFARAGADTEEGGTPPCTSNPIFCTGPVLEAVQLSRLFSDSKTFVDMTIKDDPQFVLDKFIQLKKEGLMDTKPELAEFVAEHFTGPGDELEEWDPEDWVEKPAMLNNIDDITYKEWALNLTKLWKVLGRKMKKSVEQFPDRHSLMYVPNPFIVPGDRFREFYYWDSYWIVKGLILSEMHQTVKGMLENFLYIVNQLGFVPNGGRIYYTNRSQPPMLIPMVDAYYNATQETAFLRDNIELLEKEYMFWQSHRNVSVTVGSEDGTSEETVYLSQYRVDIGRPRPEGFFEDYELAHSLPTMEKHKKYADLASAAESGWDFSTRWFDHQGEHAYSLESIRTTDIVPVDLNAILLWNEHLLAKFMGILGETSKKDMYEKLAERRADAMNRVMWNNEAGSWFDYDLKMGVKRNKFYPSNIVPLLVMRKAGLGGIEEKTQKVIDYLKAEAVLSYPGGIPSSRIPSKQQWDFPNAWSPLIYFVVEALASCPQHDAQALALNASETWLGSNYALWKKTHHMYEKYDVRYKGTYGGGGEYDVQIGFGWTNGVALHLLDKYGKKIKSGDKKDPLTTVLNAPTIATSSIYIIIIFSLLGLAVIGVIFFIYHRRRQQLRRRVPSSQSGNKVYIPCTDSSDEARK